MENSKENIDNLFGNGLNNFEPDTPYDAWGSINAKLDRAQRKKRLAYWRWSSLIVLLGLSFAGGYYFNDLVKSPENSPIIEDGSVNTESISATSPIKDFESEPAELKQEEIKQSENQNSSNNNIFNISESFKSAEKGNKPEKSIVDREDPGKVTPEPTIIANNSANVKPEPITSIDGTRESDKGLKTDILLDLKSKSIHYAPRGESHSLALKDYPDAPFNENRPNTFIPALSKRNFFSDLELSALAGVSFPFRTVVYNSSDPIAENNVNNEQLSNTSTYGLRVSKRWNFLEYHIGIFQSSWKQSTNNIILEGEPVNNTAQTYTDMVAGITSIGNLSFGVGSGPPIQPAIENGKFFLVPNIIQEYQFIDIPVGVSYFFIDKRLQLKFNLGFNNRILNASSVVLDFPNGLKEDYEGLVPNRYSLQLFGGPNLAYKLTNRLKWQVEPVVNYGVSPISNSNGVKTYLHQFSILSGISYTF